MKSKLLDVMKKQKVALEDLLFLLEEQHGYIIRNDVFGMESIVERIQLADKQVAEWEVQRRQITKEQVMSSLLSQFNDDSLNDVYREIKKILETTILQKDTNELLIKQELAFANRILSILNPDRNMKTYNSYGRMKK